MDLDEKPPCPLEILWDGELAVVGVSRNAVNSMPGVFQQAGIIGHGAVLCLRLLRGVPGQVRCVQRL